jgi:hypothetical protein
MAVRSEGVTVVVWLTRAALGDVPAATTGSTVPWCPSRGEAGSGQQR